LAGLTLGTSVVVKGGIGGIVAVAAGTNVVGGAVTRATDSSTETRPGDLGEMGFDLAAGAVGGVIGAKVQGAYSSRIAHLESTEAGMREAARRGGRRSLAASRGRAGVARKVAETKRTAEIAATVAGAKTTNVIVPVGKAWWERRENQR